MSKKTDREEIDELEEMTKDEQMELLRKARKLEARVLKNSGAKRDKSLRKVCAFYPKGRDFPPGYYYYSIPRPIVHQMLIEEGSYVEVKHAENLECVIDGEKVVIEEAIVARVVG